MAWSKGRKMHNYFVVNKSERIFPNTVFPRIVSAETILFWRLECDNYSKEETPVLYTVGF